MLDGERFARKRDERAARRVVEVVVVGAGLHAEGVADALGDKRDVILVLMAEEDADDAAFFRDLADGCTASARREVAFAAEIAGMGGDIPIKLVARDGLAGIVFRLISLTDERVGNVAVRDVEAHERRRIVFAGFRFEPCELIVAESGVDAELSAAVAVHHDERAHELSLLVDADGIIAVSEDITAAEEAVRCSFVLVVLPVNAHLRLVVVVAVNGRPRDAEGFHECDEFRLRASGIVEFPIGHVARDEDEIGICALYQLADVFVKILLLGVGKPHDALIFS